MSDLELVQQYVRENSQAAFTALVNRHVNLVYSAALRQVRSPQLAEEVSQSVFLDLSRRASKLPPAQPLAAWLYVVTRRTAIDVVRHESRRLARETTAAEIAAMKTPPHAWAQVERLLDDAMETLNDTERSALVLRFFENQSLREVGDALGISEDTAQKRVSRALDRLRLAFASRGVAIGAATLATDLSAHAAHAAPAGLAATISASAAALPSATAVAMKQFAMTTAQKILATAAALALGFALYQGGAAVRLHHQVQEGQQRLDRLADTARQLRLERDSASRELANLSRNRPAASGAEPSHDDALAREAAAWFARIAQLKQALVLHPELAIPELQLLTEDQWILASLARREDLTQSLLDLRIWAKSAFVSRVANATNKYFASAHALPGQFEQLVPFLSPTLEPAIFERYDFQNENGRMTVAEKLTGAVDPDDLALCAWENGPSGLNGYIGRETASGRSVREADQAYARTHGGAHATDPAQLSPFLSRPLEAAALARLFRGLPLAHSSPPSAP